MKELAEILHRKFKIQPNANEVRKWLLSTNWFYCGSGEKWDFLNRFMARGEQPLQPGYFVPYKNGKVLEKPDSLDQNDPYIEAIHASSNLKEWKEYQKAKEGVIYDGYKLEYDTEYTIQLNIIKNYDFDGGLLKMDECIIFYKNKENTKTISSMEGQPITKQFWINFLK